MATNASPFLVNIVELQNIATGISGGSSNDTVRKLESDVVNIQKMVNYTKKTISADVLKSFTLGKPVDVMANLNLSNARLYSNLMPYTVNPDALEINKVGLTGNEIYVNSDSQTISFITAGTQSLLIDASGHANFSKNLYVGGNVYATNLIQTSDIELKGNIKPFKTSVEQVLKLSPQTFEWLKTGSQDIGFISQEVEAVWPSLTEDYSDGTRGLVYSRFIPLLLESIRELNSRVLDLESKLKA